MGYFNFFFETMAAQKKAAKQIDSITDYHEEETTSVGDAKGLAESALVESEQSKKDQEELKARRLREKELAKIKVNDEDVAFLTHELEMSEDAADRALRESGNDLVKAANAFISAP